MKERYEELRQKFSILPSYDVMNAEFNIDALDSSQTIIAIKKRIAEKFEIVLDTFDHILQPNPDSIADMVEMRSFTEGEKKQIFETYKKLMFHYRAFLEGDFDDEQANARIVRAAYDDWQIVKKIVKPTIKKLKDTWEKHTEEKEIHEYFG